MAFKCRERRMTRLVDLRPSKNRIRPVPGTTSTTGSGLPVFHERGSADGDYGFEPGPWHKIAFDIEVATKGPR
jgi:hypothetical protein